MSFKEIDPILEIALREDMPAGDITSENLISPDSISKAIIIAKEDGIAAGIDVACRVFWKVDKKIVCTQCFKDGDQVKKSDVLMRLEGCSLSLLKGERTALNFLQRLSGIATKTRLYTKELKGTKTKLLDTRKTTPGLRLLEKHAVKMGGGENHRFSLSDMVLIKDNHLRLTGSISQAVRRVRERIAKGIKIEVETTSLAEVKEAFESGADMIMLDNMTNEEIVLAVDWVSGRVPLEVSGNVDRKRLKELARLNVDYVSVGKLTHSFKSLDISMEFLS
ncbi:MAG: carboxylating nicotinate-nucleotide diphosphorylase [Candidatus Aminicenantes bacterium]|nr:carboxylating nicotinate-nucleotide diphosphorylase [Candidatus Aminicenantes bacterium]